MIRLDYEFTAKSPLHTGADVDMGTMKTLRRQKIVFSQPQEYETVYTDEERRDAIIEILYAVHRAIDWDKVKRSRLMGIWDEAHGKLLKAATASDQYSFFESLCASWDVQSLAANGIDEILESITGEELLRTVRENSRYLILKLRKRVQEKNLDTGGSLFDFSKKDKPPVKYHKTFEMIPCISGNSIRGKLRRLVMYDFCERVGITKLSKDNYHILFTGGVLDQSTAYEDLEKREQLIAMCPPMGVLGGAIGNMTISGMMSVGMAYPVCREIGTGEKSYWEYLDTIFQTRLDSSKTEKKIEIEGAHESPDQMKYEYEVFSPGTPFSHGFGMEEKNDLGVSCFWHILNLFKHQPYVGGMWAVGNAEIDLSELIVPDGAADPYIAHIEEKKDEIRKFFDLSFSLSS